VSHALFAQISLETNTDRLVFLVDSFQQEEQAAMQRVNDWCATHGMSRTVTENGQTKAIVDVVNGRPLLQRDHNVNAAITSGATHLLPGGISGLGLTGAGLTIGMWEGQSVATQHVEFAASGGGSRVQIMDGGMNGSAQVVVQGGLSPYSYAWSNGGTTGSITGLGAGVYSVSVSGGSGQIWVDSLNITEPLPLVAVEGV